MVVVGFWELVFGLADGLVTVDSPTDSILPLFIAGSVVLMGCVIGFYFYTVFAFELGVEAMLFGSNDF